MMELKGRLKYVFHLFCGIVTAQVVYTVLLSEIRGMNANIDYQNLQTIVITAFVGVLPTFALSWTETVSRRVYFLKVTLNFILTASVVFITLYYRGALNSEDMIFPIVLFLILYITFQIRAELHNKKAIDELNKRINATHQD